MHNSAFQQNMYTRSCFTAWLTTQASTELSCPILPGLPDDVAKLCLALVPRCYFPNMGAVNKRWNTFIQSKEFITARKEVGKLEEWLYVLTDDAGGRGRHWEILGHMGGKSQLLPPMPGPAKDGFGVVVLDGKMFVMSGYSVDDGVKCVSATVCQYDSRLNRWSMVANMNEPRYDFACAEVDGLIYVVGGYGSDGDVLPSAELYNPDNNKWTLIDGPRLPKWGCFAFSFNNKLCVMGGRSRYIIGHSRSMDVYDHKSRTWHETSIGCVVPTTHAVLGERLFCMERMYQRKLVIYDPADQSWRRVQVPLLGSFAVGLFCFGVLDGKLLLFSSEEDSDYKTLLFDPDASEWGTSELKPTGLCLCSVTIAV